MIDYISNVKCLNCDSELNISKHWCYKIGDKIESYKFFTCSEGCSKVVKNRVDEDARKEAEKLINKRKNAND